MTRTTGRTLTDYGIRPVRRRHRKNVMKVEVVTRQQKRSMFTDIEL